MFKPLDPNAHLSASTNQNKSATPPLRANNILLFASYVNKKHTPPKDTIFTLASCVRLYYKKHLEKLKKSTQQGVKAKGVYFLNSPISGLPIKEVSAKKIDLWLEWLKQHKTASNKNRNSFYRELSILHAILNWYKHYIDETFVLPILKRHKVLCNYKTLPQRRPDYFARPEELHQWINYLKKNKQDPVYYLLAQFMVLTGVRVGEACALTWRDVNFKEKTLSITKTLAWDYHSKNPYLNLSPKTPSSVRRIYLAQILIKSLKEFKTTSKNKDYIFVNTKNKLLKYSVIQSRFNSAFKSCNLPWRSTHICRHSYATMALMATKNLSAVQACLGHSSQKATQRYAKIMSLLNTDIAEDIALFWHKFKIPEV